jgi:hypothetical protein
MSRKGTITNISVQNNKINTFTLHIRKNNLLTNIASLSVVASLGNSDKIANIDFLEDDLLQFYIEDLAYSPVAYIEVAWRF